MSDAMLFSQLLINLHPVVFKRLRKVSMIFSLFGKKIVKEVLTRRAPPLIHVRTAFGLGQLGQLMKLMRNPELLKLTEELRNAKDGTAIQAKMKEFLDKDPETAKALMSTLQDPSIQDSLKKLMESDVMKADVAHFMDKLKKN